MGLYCLLVSFFESFRIIVLKLSFQVTIQKMKKYYAMDICHGDKAKELVQ